MNAWVKKKIKAENLKSGGFYTRIPNYTPLSILFRVIINSLIAVFIIQTIVPVVRNLGVDEHLLVPKLNDYLRAIFYYNLLGELLIVSDNILEHFLPIPKKIKLRIAIQTLGGVVLIFITYTLMSSIDSHYNQVSKATFMLGIAVGLVFITMFSNSLLLLRLTDKWIQSQKQIDFMKQEKLTMDYNSLQDQLNPHFLFNNLSVLKSLIIYEKESAINFTENFTNVYRYVLKSKEKRLIVLSDELRFIESYLGLHKERLGDGLITKFEIDSSESTKRISPLTLQLLVENAIKHNIVDKESPLKIIIRAKENFLEVENNLQLKKSSYSTNTGLKNLIKRYHFLTEEDVEIWETAADFLVKVPLL